MIRPCRCGLAPTLTTRPLEHMHILQVKCSCGRHGVACAYIKPEDRGRTRQAAIDGWNLSES